MDGQFASFLSISALAIITPGPDMALVMKNALSGRGRGVVTALGVILGQLVWVVAASAGVAAVLLASEPLFNAVKLAGAAYLVFLGGQALVSAFRSNPSQTTDAEGEPGGRDVTRGLPFGRGSFATSATRRWLSLQRVCCRSSFPPEMHRSSPCLLWERFSVRWL